MCGYSSTATSRCLARSASKTSWAVCGSVASLPVKGPKPSTKRPASSNGAMPTSPWCLPSTKSTSPQPGATWTIPVPSPATTFGFPFESRPPSMTRWQLTPVLPANCGIVRNAAVGVLRRQVVKGTGVGPSDQVFSLTVSSVSKPPCSLKIWAIVLSLGVPFGQPHSGRPKPSLNSRSGAGSSRLSLAK